MNTLAKILDPDNIVKTSEKALGISGGTKISEAIDEMNKIAKKHNLSVKYDWNKVVALLETKK